MILDRTIGNSINFDRLLKRELAGILGYVEKNVVLVHGEEAANGPSPFFQFANRVKNDSQWQYLEVDTCHYIISERPARTVKLLDELA